MSMTAEARRHPGLADVDAERRVIGILLNTRILSIRSCTDSSADHFFDPVHRQVYEAILAAV